MITEQHFQDRLNKAVKDWQTRLVFADFLEERGDVRALGYRAMGRNLIYPSRSSKYSPRTRRFRKTDWCWYNTIVGKSYAGTLKEIWYKKLEEVEKWLEEHANTPYSLPFTVVYKTRREAEDDAAIAFSMLSVGIQAVILAGR